MEIKQLMYCSLLAIILLVYTCNTPPNPINPHNAGITLELLSPVQSEKELFDTVGNSICVLIGYTLEQILDSVSVAVWSFDTLKEEGELDTTMTITMFPGSDDNVRALKACFTLTKEGRKIIVAHCIKENGERTKDTGTVVAIKQSSEFSPFDNILI